ncbi:MAG: FtsX-like permease family protein [Acidobacteriia bacterium]|nr:FtsX-like permease family protein [Terriglobia bacterium]MYG03756.1 FtsX-like permease family protein [Terriglobia bacterium]MYK11974.1 FtsX-like permease family protein [Terriglobia bacterium]
MASDLRVAFRSLLRKPAYFLVASLTLALGVGANTAVFSLFEALFLRLLPVERPQELAILGPGAVGVFSRSDMPQSEVFAFHQFQALRQDSPSALDAVAAAATFSETVYLGDRIVAGSELERASCQLVSGSYFPLLGVRPFLGRMLDPGDDTAPGGNPVAVVSHPFWAGQLDADPDAVGSTIRLQDLQYVVLGVAPPSFRGHVVGASPDIWVPLSMQESVTGGPSRLEPGFPVETYWLNILMRVRPGVPLDEAGAAINLRLRQLFLERAGEGISDEDRERLDQVQIAVTPLDRGVSRLRDSAQRPLGLLWAATGLVLLVACANLGNLLLVRASERADEVGVRRALGAGRGDVLRTLLAESIVLAAAGTLLGGALALQVIPVLVRWLGAIRGVDTLDVSLTWPVLFFAAGTGVLTLLLFGLVPAARLARRTLAHHIRAGQLVGSPGMAEARAQAFLVAAQCAMAFVLLTAAGLVLKTLAEVRATDFGLDAENVVGILVDPRGGGLPASGQPSMRRRILDRVQSLPGVETASFTGSLPLRGNYGMRTISVSGYTPAEGEDMGVIQVWASPDYFETLGIRVLEGGTPGSGERDLVVVNQAFADKFFAGSSALGAVIDGSKRIKGVVADVRHVNPRDDPPAIVYQSSVGYEGFLRTLAVRSSVPSAGLAAAVRQAIEEEVPGLPIAPGYDTVALHLEDAIALERMIGKLVSAFACVTLLLSGLGLFGVCSHMVRIREAEIGVQAALGASQRRLRWMVFRRAAVLTACGIVVGLGASMATGRLAAGFFYEVSPFEWHIIALAALAVSVCALTATAIPALRAGRVSPSQALRQN